MPVSETRRQDAARGKGGKCDRRGQAGQAVYQSLTDTARRTQPPLVAYLTAQQQAGAVAAYEPFWVFNGLAVEGDLKTLLALAARPDVARLKADDVLVALAQDEKRLEELRTLFGKEEG